MEYGKHIAVYVKLVTGYGKVFMVLGGTSNSYHETPTDYGGISDKYGAIVTDKG